MYKAGLKFLGGCCGTNAAHITRVASAARMVWPIDGPRIEINEARDPGHEPRPLAKRSSFGAMLGRRFVTSVEVNPGLGLSVDRQLEAAKMLYAAGSDVINIADGPRATARMSNMALAVTLQRETNKEVLLHLCCRDRNLLGLQAAALGAHVLGVRNLVVITGDPPKVGDYPDATAVYDLDSIGLLKMLRSFNRGVDYVGKGLGEQTGFVLCTGVEPAALDFKREMLRLRQKVEAGANCVMTQPIYDPRHLDRFLEASADIDLPVIVGILPLASHRNAEFIHHHIPGMSVPDSTRKRMRQAVGAKEARQAGVDIAIESMMGVRDKVAGVYIMPPLGRYDMAAQILDALGDDRALHQGVASPCLEAIN
jgi:methionine synthase / methylenetetrahydrofolate reductase(NADPH)